MLNPVYADAIVDNMAATQIRLYGIVMSEYPNLMKMAVETWAYEDPRYVSKDGELIWIGDAAITTEMQLDVMDKETAEDVEWDEPVNPGGTRLDSRTSVINKVRLNTADPNVQASCQVHIDVTDYQWASDEEMDDTEDLKYARTVRMVFVVQEEVERLVVPKVTPTKRPSKRKKTKKRRK